MADICRPYLGAMADGLRCFSRRFGLSVPGLAVMIALQSSLQHEIIHGHPTRHPLLNAALVFASLNLLIPFGRFRDTHLAHHTDERLTDPYDDPESNYLDPAVWHAFPTWLQRLYMFNATLAGRLLIGVLISQYYFMRSDLRDICAGRMEVLRAWLLHIPGGYCGDLGRSGVRLSPLGLCSRGLRRACTSQDPYICRAPCPQRRAWPAPLSLKTAAFWRFCF